MLPAQLRACLRSPWRVFQFSETTNRAGYRVFTDAESFREYVETEILALETAET